MGGRAVERVIDTRLGHLFYIFFFFFGKRREANALFLPREEKRFCLPREGKSVLHPRPQLFPREGAQLFFPRGTKKTELTKKKLVP